MKILFSGGLGNQLFQYFEAISRLTAEDENVELDFKDVYLGKNLHGSCITSFDLPINGSVVNLNPGRFLIFLGKLRKSIANKLKINFGVKNSLDELSLVEVQSMYPYEKVKFAYPDWKPHLKKPSPWFMEMKKLLGADFLSIHIRRGDYLAQRNLNTIGVLSSDYYLSALTILEKEFGLLPVFVFSDDISIRHEVQDVLPFRTQYVVPPANTDPAESLMLMSFARGQVISNSTFSWWSARFAQNNAMIIAPKPWFKSLTEPDNLIPSDWILLESKWLVPHE